MPIGAVRGRISKKAASISVWRRSRALTAIPEVPFVGVQAAFINRSTPNSELASQFIEK
jgi:hypothetical protein